jgi:hypothetical protein
VFGCPPGRERPAHTDIVARALSRLAMGAFSMGFPQLEAAAGLSNRPLETGYEDTVYARVAGRARTIQTKAESGSEPATWRAKRRLA